MKKIISLLIIFTVGLFAGPVFAANKNAGTSGAQFLKIGAGARPTAMGDAFVGLADDVNAVYFNPAGISNISHPELLALHTQWIQGMGYNYGAFAYPTDYGAFALSAQTLKVDDLQKRSNDETLQGSFSAMDAAYGITYAGNVGPFLSYGITGRFVKQEIDTESAGAWGGDIGLLYRMRTHPFSFGMAVRDFGQPIKFKSESDPMPMTVDVGMGMSFLDERLKLGINCKKPRDNGFKPGLGAEYRRHFRSDFHFALRSGYNATNTDSSGASGISLGGGFGFKQFDFDVAWVPFGDLGNSFRYAAQVRF